MSEATADIGLIGLAVMGENLVLNVASRGYTIAVYNRTTSKVDDFIAGRAAGKSIIGTHSVEELCANLKRPRRIMIMVKAGAAIDLVIDSLLPHLEKGDIITAINGKTVNSNDGLVQTIKAHEVGDVIEAYEIIEIKQKLD